MVWIRKPPGALQWALGNDGAVQKGLLVDISRGEKTETSIADFSAENNWAKNQNKKE